MRFNATNLAATLQAILGTQAIVIRQGNVFSPQGGEENPTKPKTWCAYRIDGVRTVTMPHYVPDMLATPNNWSVVHKIAKITLQFVGDVAEDLANSVAHWVHRASAQAAFNVYDAKMFADNGDVIVSDFDQQGGNTVFAYNVSFRIVYADEINTLQTRPMPGIVFQAGALTPH